MQVGQTSMVFKNNVYITASASVVGNKEAEGPLAEYFDETEADDMFGGDTWEEAESILQKRTALLAIRKAALKRRDIRYIFAGDLLGQLIATSFGTQDLDIPLFGLYGACSTCGEALILGAMSVDAGHADYVLSMVSSHFAGAEKQFRFPLAYGNQRPSSSSWTVTGCGAFVVGKHGNVAKITAATPGRIVDLGLKDSMNMGACMAPAAADTLFQHFSDFNRTPADYDKIVTGDLGVVGRKILIDFINQKGLAFSDKHMDCGIEIYDPEKQDTHAGGSGCGCSASVLSAYILPKIQSGEWKRILFLPTGALHSQVSFNSGKSVPGIAHAVVIESI